MPLQFVSITGEFKCPANLFFACIIGENNTIRLNGLCFQIVSFLQKKVPKNCFGVSCKVGFC